MLETLKNKVKNVEVIQTGLTRNYVDYWTEKQAIKEALQNIAYGVTKSGETFKADWDRHDRIGRPSEDGNYRPFVEENELGMGIIEDNYTGFEKSMLYIGESGQRKDEDGLGNFGEGWKVFLLVMARNNRTHVVHTVGFSFYGRMVETPHGTEVLTIYVEPNKREVGTRVEFECTKKDFDLALQSFAIFQNIDSEYIKKEGIIPNRNNEFWVSGVRIEQDENLNPLNLYFSYNVKDRTLMNRDRSQVNTTNAMQKVRILLSNNKDEKIMEELIDQAMKGTPYEDIQKGPLSMYSSKKEKWQNAISKAHGVEWDKLVIPSVMDIAGNKEVLYRGYTMVRLPMQWHSELEWIGMKTVKDILNERPIIKIVEPNLGQEKMLQSAKLKVKKCLKLDSVNELPTIKIAETIETGGSAKTLAFYNTQDKEIVLSLEIFDTPRQLTKSLLHECVHWKTGYNDNTEHFTNAFEDIIADLLGLED